MVDNYGGILYTETFNILADGKYPFIFTINAGTGGIYPFSGRVYLGENRIISLREKYEVTGPALSATATGPVVAGHTPFQLNVLIDNQGKIPAAVQVAAQGGSLSDTQSITLQAGEARSISYTTSISTDTIFTFDLTGDLVQTINFPVRYGEGASVVLNTQATYPEGRVDIPFKVRNTGPMEESVEVKIELQRGAVIITEQNRTYTLPPGGERGDSLSFDLAEGEYQITISSQQPPTSAQASFSVRKESKVEVTVATGAVSEGLIPITAGLTNLGYNNVAGSVQLLAVSGQGTTVWNVSREIYLPSSLSPAPYTILFNINPSALPAGAYTLKTDFFASDGVPMASHTSPFTIYSPNFQILQIPPDQIFIPGQEATFTFRVRNIGNQEGEVGLRFKAYDLIDLTKREWLKAGEEKEFSYGFMLPEDLEEKDYFAEYEMKVRDQGVEGSRGQVKYHLAGINIAVRASLDKQYYQEGESAHLTLYISNLNAQSSTLNLFARVNYPGYESNLPFTLNISQTIAFDIPLAKITGEKLFFGIYHESGRSIHLNSFYIYKAGDVITITTDKQVYKPGETVAVAVAGNTSGTLTLTAPNYEETVPFNNTATRSFPLPSTMTAGTYYVSYQLSTSSGQNYTGTRPFDVDGIRVKVKEATLDKAKYAPSDTINLTLSIESNQNLGAILKTWLVDPDKNYTLPQTQNILLATTAPLLTSQNIALNTAKLGLHRLVYGIYSDDMLLSAGSEAFDMGEAVVLGIATDQAYYPDGSEPITAAVNLYGSGPATLELFQDGQLAASQQVTLAGFTTIQQIMPVILPGPPYP